MVESRRSCGRSQCLTTSPSGKARLVPSPLHLLPFACVLSPLVVTQFTGSPQHEKYRPQDGYCVLQGSSCHGGFPSVCRV